jgi:hypothetical protein
MLAVITFSSDIQLGLVDICQRWLEGDTAVGKEVEASIHGTSFSGLSEKYQFLDGTSGRRIRCVAAGLNYRLSSL